MDPLTWLLIPMATGMMASLWGCVVSRRRRTNDWAHVQRYDRLRAALARAAS
ncbi:hypothetical protein [Streptomyces sp. NPDC046985]|uniref:hypothetical protein n=1 Tax=Streptomyces sp. NPDC046985 TaxID=3155377 RepID=UPI0033D8D0B6